MRLRRFVVPMAIVVVALLIIGGTAGLISAAYYAPSVVERPAETGGTPQEPEPVPTPTVAPKAPNEPLELAKAVELLVEPALLTEGSKRGSGQESVPSGDGEVYTWEDGDRTMRVVLQDNLVVQESTAVTPQDDVIRRGTKDSIVRKQAWHGPDTDPVFRSESGSSLMTLPGGVLLALDPEWDEEMVADFFKENALLPEETTELDYIKNGFLLETSGGFPSLERANALAAQEGVVAASPNWAREAELK